MHTTVESDIESVDELDFEIRCAIVFYNTWTGEKLTCGSPAVWMMSCRICDMWGYSCDKCRTFADLHKTGCTYCQGDYSFIDWLRI